MKTELLFMKDCYLKEFDAKFIDKGKDDQGYFVVLDKTAFYPLGGGQPSDKGTLNGIPVKIVIKDKGVVKHYTEEPIDDDNVHGILDWERRHKYMRMHSAQHLLSAIILDKWEASTAGNQIELEYSRIDFHPLKPQEDFTETVTKEFNEYIDKGIPVKIYFTTREEVLKTIDERRRNLFSRLPEFIKDIRIVEVEGVDKVPCGGTHVKNTEEIGHIRITKIENKGKDTTRVVFELEEH